MNGLGMIVTKYASAANRVTLQQSKNLLIWIFFLAYRGHGHEEFKVLQLTGFLVLVCGVILFNEVLEIPILGFDQYTKRAIEKNKLRSKSLNEEGETEHYDPDATDLMKTDATDYA